MNGVDLSIPIGGVTPWLGQMMGLTIADLPNNFIVVDGGIINRGAINLTGGLSPFEGVSIPDTSRRSLVGVTTTNMVGTISGGDNISVPVTKSHLPNTFKVAVGGQKVLGAKSIVNNLNLSGASIAVEVKADHAIGDGNSTLSVPQPSSIDGFSTLPTGAAYKVPITYDGSSIWTTSQYTHSHNINLSHNHNFRIYNAPTTNSSN